MNKAQRVGLLVLTGLLVAGLAWRGLSPAAGPPSASPSSTAASPRDHRAGTRSRTTAGRLDAQPALPPGPIRFTEMTEAAGIDFIHTSGNSPEKPFPAANGSGVGALDYDLDGRYDLYFPTGTFFPIDRSRPAPADEFYRNLGGWEFENVTEQARLGHNGYTAGVAVSDYDSDGFPDLYVTCYGANCLYRNQGDGTFADVSRSSGADDDKWATSAAFLDYDGDGLVDLYVCNYGRWSLETNQFCGDRVRNVRLFCSPHSIPPEKDILYHNEGDGTFRDATDETGVGARSGRSQGVVAADVNDDGRIDLYLGNDLHPNFLFLNEGNGTFRDASEHSGAAYSHMGGSQAGMGVDAADIDADGRLDLFVTNFENDHNTLYQNLGDGLFEDVGHLLGLNDAGLPWIGWGTALADFDLDGRPDVVVTNGHVDDNLHELGRDSPYEQPPLVWHNTGRGRFESLGGAVGSYFARPHNGRGLAVADFDNDGDLDLAIGHQDAPPALLRNDSHGPTPSHTISLRLVGTRSNRDAVGSRITLHAGDRTITEQIKGGGSYLSAHDLRRVLTVPAGETELRLEVLWPSGMRSLIEDLEPGASYAVVEPGGSGTLPRTVVTPF